MQAHGTALKGTSPGCNSVLRILPSRGYSNEVTFGGSGLRLNSLYVA